MTIINNKDERGRFVKGNLAALGHNNPIAAKVTELRRAFLSVITPDEMVKVTRRHLELIYDASDPKASAAALTLLYDRLFGKAKETIELDLTTTGAALDPRSYTDEQLSQVLGILEAPARRITTQDQPPADPLPIPESDTR